MQELFVTTKMLEDFKDKLRIGDKKLCELPGDGANQSHYKVYLVQVKKVLNRIALVSYTCVPDYMQNVQHAKPVYREEYVPIKDLLCFEIRQRNRSLKRAMGYKVID